MVKGVFFLRKISFIFFLFFSVMSFTFSSFAGVASGSNAKRVHRASWSNASHAWEDFKDSFDRINDADTVSSNDIELFSSDSRRVHMYGLTSEGQKYYTAGTLGSALALPTLSSGHYKRVWIDLYKEWLPAAGTYKFYWAFTDVLQNIRSSGVDNVVGDWSVIADTQKNVDPGSSSGTVSIYKSQNLWSSWINVKTSSKTSTIGYYMDLYDSANVQQIKLVLRQFGAEFKTDSSATTVDAPSSNNQSSTDIVSDALENLGANSDRQVEQGDSIIELIKNTIQTISSQLESFWNQLAGEFTNLYNKMNEQHQERLDKMQEQIDSAHEDTDNIIQNQKENTDQITGGYDSSGLDSSGNKLNDSLTGLEDKENAIHDQASGWITDFTLPNFDQLLESGGILAACLWLGQFWQSMFTNMGAFNIPVTLSLCLIFVLMLVGYHRFKR